MQSAEQRLTYILKDNEVDFVASLPCDRIKFLLQRLQDEFSHIPLTREEDGVGIAAGIALAGRRPAMFVQSSGIGNMINALLSLTGFYKLPLAVFVSHRGIYKEGIAAQVPMGKRLAPLLRGAGIPFSIISSEADISVIEKKLPDVYRKSAIHVFLLSPALFEGVCDSAVMKAPACPVQGRSYAGMRKETVPSLTRYEVISAAAPFLEDRVVVCNLGVPSKELFRIHDQPSNFYMLGSMGMSTPTGLGIALSSGREVVVIDGDGSLLMNPGTLATVAHFNSGNLTILAIDNSAYGSTGSQATLTASCVDLAAIALGFGIGQVIRAADRRQIASAMRKAHDGVKFIHVRALPGNSDAPNISLDHLQIRDRVEEFIRAAQ